MVKAKAGPLIGKELSDSQVEKDGVIYVYNEDGSLKETKAVQAVEQVFWGLTSEGNLFYTNKDGGKVVFPSLKGPQGDSVKLEEVLKNVNYDQIAQKVNIDYKKIIDSVVDLVFKEALMSLDIVTLAEAVTERIAEKINKPEIVQALAKEIITNYKDELTIPPEPPATAKQVASEFAVLIKSLL